MPHIYPPPLTRVSKFFLCANQEIAFKKPGFSRRRYKCPPTHPISRLSPKAFASSKMVTSCDFSEF